MTLNQIDKCNLRLNKLFFQPLKFSAIKQSTSDKGIERIELIFWTIHLLPLKLITVYLQSDFILNAMLKLLMVRHCNLRILISISFCSPRRLTRSCGSVDPK